MAALTGRKPGLSYTELLKIPANISSTLSTVSAVAYGMESPSI
jgi:hypothetical protein